MMEKPNKWHEKKLKREKKAREEWQKIDPRLAAQLDEVRPMLERAAMKARSARASKHGR